jgi:hypothetical protein
MKRALTIVALVLSTAVIGLQSYWRNGPTWPSGTVTEYIQLSSTGAPTLLDGCADWSCSASAAMTRWNLYLNNMQFRPVPNATQGQGEQNGRNDMFFAADYYGHSFDTSTLAITLWWYLPSQNRMTEADIVFNSTKRWNSYRGSYQSGTGYDLRRVAIHELGHVAGLGHPDEHLQAVTALMNSQIANIDDLTADDIAGGQSMYGGGASGVPINFPPRNETYDFRTWLETKYKDGLGRAAESSYADVEGSVVWVQEYMRYRLNGCSDSQATDRVTIQIKGGGIVSVCGAPESTTVFNFPPRDQSYGFRLVLEDFYKNTLRRDAVKTSVNAEGDVVWIQEYLRYRLNGCTHAQSIDKINQQIDGRGIAPVCR